MFKERERYDDEYNFQPFVPLDIANLSRFIGRRHHESHLFRKHSNSLPRDPAAIHARPPPVHQKTFARKVQDILRLSLRSIYKYSVAFSSLKMEIDVTRISIRRKMSASKWWICVAGNATTEFVFFFLIAFSSSKSNDKFAAGLKRIEIWKSFRITARGISCRAFKPIYHRRFDSENIIKTVIVFVQYSIKKKLFPLLCHIVRLFCHAKNLWFFSYLK